MCWIFNGRSFGEGILKEERGRWGGDGVEGLRGWGGLEGEDWGYGIWDMGGRDWLGEGCEGRGIGENGGVETHFVYLNLDEI